MVLKKFRNKKGGRTFSEGWGKGTNDIKSSANNANEKRKEMMQGINRGMTDFTRGFKNKQRDNQLKTMIPVMGPTVGGRRRRRRRSRTRRKTKSRTSRKRRSKRRRKTRKKRRR